jgi:hypothetical protein
VSVQGLPAGATVADQVEAFKRGLRDTLTAVHSNLGFLDRKQWLA